MSLALLAEKIARLDDELRSIKTQRESIASAPRPLVESSERMRQALDSLERGLELGPGLGTLAARSDGDESLIPRYLFGPLDDSVLLGLIIAANRGAVEKVILNALRAREIVHAPGLPKPERLKRLGELDSLILKVERTRERLHREAESIGLTVARQVDADPRVLLAHDAQLQDAA